MGIETDDKTIVSNEDLEDFGGLKEVDKVEINDMLSFFEAPEVVKKEVEIEEVEKKLEEEVVVKEEGKKEEEVVVPPEVVEEVVVDERDSQIDSLRAELARISGLLARDGKEQVYPGVQKEVVKEEVVKEEEKRKEKPLNSIFQAIYDKKEFLTQEQLDQVVDKPELINEAIYGSRVEMAELLAEAIPTLVNLAVNREILVQKAVTSFYDANKDLTKYSQYVQMVFKEVEQGNADKPYPEIFELTAKESRKRLGLKEPTLDEKAQSVTGVVKPAFAGSKTGTTTPIAKGGKKEIFDENARDFFDELL